MARYHQSRLLAGLENLDEQTRYGVEMTEKEVPDLAVVRLLVAVVRLLVTNQHTERCVFPAGPLDLFGAGQSY